MGYIGKGPSQVFRTFSVKDSFTGDGSTTVFTLSRAAYVGSPNDVQVFVDNVRQEPGVGKSYTIGLDGSSNATQLTFSSAPPNTSEIYVIIAAEPTSVLVPAAGTITSEMIADGTVVAADIDDGTVTNAKLTNSSITVSGDSGSDGVSLGETLTVSGTSNEIETAVTSNTLTIGLPNDVTIAGNLTVNGTTTTISTTNTTISDNLLELNSGVASNANDSGIIIERGSTGDNAIIAWDESADEFILGTTTATASDTGDLTITAGDVNVGGITTTGLTTTGDINFGDNDKAVFGASSDLQIYHNGSNSYIEDTGTGTLTIRTNGDAVRIDSTGAAQTSAVFDPTGAQELYYNNSKKFETTSGGATVTGTVVSDGLTVDTNTLYVDSANNRVGIGTTSPVDDFEVTTSGLSAGDFVVDIGNKTVNVGRLSSTGGDNGKLFVRDRLNNGLTIAGTTSADGTGLFRPDTNVMGISANGSEIARVTSSGVGIDTGGVASITELLTIGKKSGIQDNPDALSLGSSYSNTAGSPSRLKVKVYDDGGDAANGLGHSASLMNIVSGLGGHDMGFFTTPSGGSSTEVLRIYGAGHVAMGDNPNDPSPAQNNVNGFCHQKGDETQISHNGTVMIINRASTDGTIIDFRQDASSEGSISVSGATVAYNGFTGTHWSRLSDNSKPTILKGTILESLDEMMDWYQVEFDITRMNEETITIKRSYALGDGENLGDVITYDYNTRKQDDDGNDIIEEVQATIIQEADVKHTKAKISDTVDAKNVYGVFMDWDNDDDTVNDMYVAQTGTFVVRLNSSVTTLNKGDLIQSNGDGTGKVQADDIIRASTVAKVLSTTKIETYEDGSYIVPCSLHC